LLAPGVARRFDEVNNLMKFQTYRLWVDHLKTSWRFVKFGLELRLCVCVCLVWSQISGAYISFTKSSNNKFWLTKSLRNY